MAASVIFLVSALLMTATAQDPQISITPNTDDITLFQGSEFRRICAVLGEISDGVTVRLEWERNGQVVDFAEGSGLQLQLHIPEVESVHQGQYICRVMLISQSGGVPIVHLDPRSAGTLTVLDGALIHAPRQQVVLAGTSSSLNCSYPDSLITWRRQDNSLFGGRISDATFADEGVYTCDIYVPASAASITISVTLYIVVPVEIADRSTPVHHNLTSNRPVTLAVDFVGREAHALVITWYHNAQQISYTDSRIVNTFESASAEGRTEFRLPEARRTDAGLYRVVITSAVGLPGQPLVFSSQQETTFQIDVTVRPTVPADLQVSQVSSRTARVSWRLTHQTPDQAADQLILRVTFANRSLVDQQQFTGDHTSMVLENLVPANEFFVVLTAVNSDGEVTTDAATFRTLEGAPSISSLQVQRVNQTWFNVGLELAYTGGGNIVAMSLSYRPTAGNMAVTRLASQAPEGMGLSLRGVVMLTEQLHGVAVAQDAAMELEFLISVRNEFNFESTEMSVTVPAYVPVTTPVTDSTVSPGPSTDSGPLPLWLIAVIASVVTVLIMLLLLAIVVCVCVRCRAGNKAAVDLKKEQHTVDQTPSSDLGAAENGTLHKSLESIEGSHYQARSQSSSVQSEAYTPSSLEEHLERKHKRELSESSSFKVPITPSTTASNSPANFSKMGFLNSADKGLDRINEQEVPHSDDSGTESERDRFRQQKMQNLHNYQNTRGHADGSACGSSHHSLVSNGSQSGMYLHSTLDYSDPKHLYTVTSPGRRLRAAESAGMNSDCESVVSSVVSVPSSIALQQRHSLQHRSPTPYNHDYHHTEESIV